MKLKIIYFMPYTLKHFILNVKKFTTNKIYKKNITCYLSLNLTISLWMFVIYFKMSIALNCIALLTTLAAE